MTRTRHRNRGCCSTSIARVGVLFALIQQALMVFGQLFVQRGYQDDDDATSFVSSADALFRHAPQGSRRRRRRYGWTGRRRHQQRRTYHQPQQQEQQQQQDEHILYSKNGGWNLTCHFITQPLNHFDLPRNQSGTFQQRYCVNNDFVVWNDDDDDKSSVIVMDEKTPIFLYTGNESPLEEYINNTGLLWELAQEMHAQVVFAEHRYEGQSLPSPPDIPHCMAYASSIQALADYATLIETVFFGQQRTSTTSNNNNDDGTCSSSQQRRRPVIAFGGSYGGMLSSWMRMKYPNLVAGAIAGSAPIHAFPRSNRPIDGAWQIITQGLQRPYPPNRTTSTTIKEAKKEKKMKKKNHCASNLLATWPLMEILGQHGPGRQIMTLAFSLCQPLTSSSKDIPLLREWASTPWFDMAEGSFPYPSNYIPFALTHRDDVQLPAWPLQAACWKASDLHHDWGVSIHGGNVSDVRYNITYKFDGGNDENNRNAKILTIVVDWDKLTAIIPGVCDDTTTENATTTMTTSCLEDALQQLLPLSSSSFSSSQQPSPPRLQSNIMGLLANVGKAVSVWYNMTQDVPCYNLTAAPNDSFGKETTSSTTTEKSTEAITTARVVAGSSVRGRGDDVDIRGNIIIAREERRLAASSSNEPFLSTDDTNDSSSPRDRCQQQMDMGSWPALCCNEEMNLIMTLGAGLGKDAFWPPSEPRGVTSYADIVARENWTDPSCLDADGIFGFPQGPFDPWSTWYDIVYGSVSSVKTHSNIVFSNGLLDPWSAGGVYADGKWSWDPDHKPPYYKGIPGLYVQNLSSSDDGDDRMMIALLMEYGGHHTDLMFSNATHDPPDVKAAREIERDYIQRWIDQFWENEKPLK